MPIYCQNLIFKVLRLQYKHLRLMLLHRMLHTNCSLLSELQRTRSLYSNLLLIIFFNKFLFSKSLLEINGEIIYLKPKFWITTS